MRVVISGPARADLEGIRRWIAHDDPRRADSFVDELQQKIERLAYWPKRYPASSGTDQLIRRMNYRGYRIFYRIMDDGITVLHVHHHARSDPEFRP